MGLLTINGIDIPCTESSWEPVRLGDVTRSLNGRARDSATVRKANYEFTTSPTLTLDEASVLRGLVEGHGHVLSFEDSTTAASWLYTSRGVAPSEISGHSRVSGRHGSYALRLDDGLMTGPSFWPVGISSSWTVLVWMRDPLVGTWVHRIGRSDNALWENGVPGTTGDDIGELCYVTTDWRLLITSGPVGTRDFDDVVVLPFAIPDAWAPALYSFHVGRAWPALPEVFAQGTRMPAGGLTCLGRCGTGRTGPRLADVVEQFDFTLYQV